MKKLSRLNVLILAVSFSMFPLALRAQDQVSMSQAAGGTVMPASDLALTTSLGMEETISPDQTISMDFQDANLRDVLKIFSIQSGLNFIASSTVENKKVTLYLDKVPIKLAMDKLFEANKLLYEFDEDAGIFIVRGSDDDLDTITEIYTLKYRSLGSSNMEKQRVSLFESGEVTAGSSNAGASAAAVSDIKVAIQQVMSVNGKVSEDNKTNSLIVTDIPTKFPQIREVVARLDQPQSQVMLDVEMLDVSKNLVDKLGFNFSDSPFMNLGLQMASKGLAFPFNTASFKGAGTELTRTAGTLSFNGGWSVTLDLLKKNTSTKLLARPRIMTLNNETAEIGITKDEVVQTKTTYVENDTGGSRPEITFERASSLTLTTEGIGVFLRVTPMINDETGDIIMVVNPKTSSTSRSPLSAGGDTEAYDPEVRSSKSIVKVRDGETVVLGGLIRNDKQVVKTKMPVLGDIPILGMLFRGKDQTKNEERELLVFITPKIVKDQPGSFSKKRTIKVDTAGNRQRSQANKVTLFTRHEAVNTALNSLDER